MAHRKYLLRHLLTLILLELESKGRQLEDDSVTLANLKSNGDRNPKEFISESQSKGAAQHTLAKNFGIIRS
jgi:hypothetical protein